MADAFRVWVRVSALALALLVLACGRKTDPQPPELVAPQPVNQLSLTRRPDGVALGWSRPTKYAGGSTMEDLGGFVIERSQSNSRFTEIGRVPVTDRGRFQKVKRFEYVDAGLMPDTTYHYRIVAFTSDGYYSAPSGIVSVTWQPAASPSPTSTPEIVTRGQPRP